MICSARIGRALRLVCLATVTANLMAACQAEEQLRTMPSQGQMDAPVVSPDPGNSAGTNTDGDPDIQPNSAQSDAAPGVNGRVVDNQNQPVANAFVQVAPIGDTPAVPELAVFTDADGRFVWPLKPGRYRVSVRDDKGQAARDVDVVGSQPVSVVLRLR